MSTRSTIEFSNIPPEKLKALQDALRFYELCADKEAGGYRFAIGTVGKRVLVKK